ncbi:MAG: hypothetical protein HYU66_11070 [Armatimonadetes bacterium]|nr:hypothetical protein [Armatimonadota bacterium]
MTGRERIEAALSPLGSPEIPAVVCYEGIFIRDHWAELTGLPWWLRFSPDLDDQMTWLRVVHQRVPLDWINLPGCYAAAEREALRLEVSGDAAALVDTRSGARTVLEEPLVSGWTRGGQVESVHPERLPETAADVEQAVPLPPEFDREAFRRAGRADLAERLLAEFPDRYPIRHVNSPLWMCYSLWGFEGMMELTLDRPELITLACERHLARTLVAVEEAAAVGAAGVWIEECLTDLISPAAFGRMNLPYVQRVVEAARAAGLATIYYYCGGPEDRWDALFAAGADALALEETKKGFTIDIDEAVGRAGGRTAVFGNLDAVAVLEQAADAELRAEVARQVAAGRRNGGRFVMSVGSPVTPGTPVQRVVDYVDLVHELGGSGSV